MGMGMGDMPDVCARLLDYSACSKSKGRRTWPVLLAQTRRVLMGASEVLIISGFCISCVFVPFGVPLAICWLMGCAERRFIHPEA